MKKTIKIEEKEIVFESTGRTLRLYRSLFLKDLLKEFMKLNKYEEKERAEHFDTETIENFAFICAYTADSSIGTDVDAWLEQFDDPFSLLSHGEEIFGLLSQSMVPKSVPKSKKKRSHKKKV